MQNNINHIYYKTKSINCWNNRMNLPRQPKKFYKYKKLNQIKKIINKTDNIMALNF